MNNLMELVDRVTGRSVREAIEKGWFKNSKEVKAYKELQAIADQIEWVSVTDRMPEHSKVVDGYTPGMRLINIYHSNEFGGWLYWGIDPRTQEKLIQNVTHWKPVLLPPTEDK